MPEQQSSWKVRLLWPSRVREGYIGMGKIFLGCGSDCQRQRLGVGKKGEGGQSYKLSVLK